MRFIAESMFEILTHLRQCVDGIRSGERIVVEVSHPDLKGDDFEGRLVNGVVPTRIRSLRLWVDLAEILKCRLLTPRIIDSHWVELTFEKLGETSWHESVSHESVSNDVEKYGTSSLYHQIDKQEEPYFLAGFLRALKWIQIEKRQSLLDLGVSSGNEIALVKELLKEQFNGIRVVGVDHCPTAVELAKQRFLLDNVTFFAMISITWGSCLSCPLMRLSVSVPFRALLWMANRC